MSDTPVPSSPPPPDAGKRWVRLIDTAAWAESHDNYWTDTEADTITGTNAGDLLTGGSGDDLINGLGGNDRIKGWGGNDVLSGGEGADQSATGTCADEAGNTSSDTYGGIDIDLTAPKAAFAQQSPTPAPEEVVQEIASFTESLYSAQLLVPGVGRLDSDGARGGRLWSAAERASGALAEKAPAPGMRFVGYVSRPGGLGLSTAFIPAASAPMTSTRLSPTYRQRPAGTLACSAAKR